MAFDAGAVVGRLTLNTEQWHSAISRVKADQKSLQGFILRNQQQIKNLGKSFIIAGAAIVGTYALMTKSAITFESAFAGVRKTVDATEKEFAQLRTGLIRMSNEIPVAAAELAGIQEIAGQLGVRGVEELTKFTETIAKIAVTTNLTREAAATDFARIANIMQEPLKNVDRMGAAVVDLGNKSATTEAEISSFAQRIAGASKVVGLTTPDIFGIGAAFTSVGVRAERGGTAVSKALIKIGEAIKTGNKDLEVFARVAGMTSEQFVKAFEKDAGEAFAIFIEGLGKGGLEAAQILEELELGDQRLKQAFLSVGGAGGIMTESIKIASKAWEENTALTEEAEKRFATTASQLKVLRNNIVNLAIKIGDLLLPMVNKISQAISGIVVNIQKWVDNNKDLAAILTKIGLGIGILLLVLGPLLMFIPTLVAGIVGLNVVLATAGLTLGGLIVPILTIVAAIGLIIMAIVKWKAITNFLKKVWWSFVEGVNYSIKVLLENIKKIVDVMAKLPGKLGVPFKGLSEKIEGVIQTLEENTKFAEEKLTEAFTESQEQIGGISDTIKAKIEDTTKSVNNAINDMKENMTTATKEMNKSQEFFVTNFIDNVKSMLGEFGIEMRVTMEEIGGEMVWAAELVAQKWNIVFSSIGDIISTLQRGLSDTIYNLITGAKTMAQVWKAVGKSILKIIIDMLVKIITQQAVVWLMNLFGLASYITKRMATLASETYAAAFASTCAIPVVGPVIAPGVATGATAAMLAGSTAAAGLGSAVGAGIGAVPGLVEGGGILRRGWTMVGEKGPEILDLPRGATVSPLDKAGYTISVRANFYGDIHTEADFDEIAKKLGHKIENTIRGL